MWTWLTCALGLGASIVLYDGNPLHPDANRLWQMTQDLKVKAIYVNTINAAKVDIILVFLLQINVFGTSARYLSAIMDVNCSPKKSFDLSSLRAILSTGSPSTSNIYGP